MIPVKKGEDPNTYRYMMPKVQIHSNSKCTSITNTDAICHDIGRTPLCLCQWIKTVTSAAVRIADSQIQIRSPLTDKKLQEIIYDFIDHFILCPVCKNPETVMVPNGSALSSQCHACGQNGIFDTKSGAALKMAKWITKNFDKNLQQHTLADDKEITTLDDFQVIRDL